MDHVFRLCKKTWAVIEKEAQKLKNLCIMASRKSKMKNREQVKGKETYVQVLALSATISVTIFNLVSVSVSSPINADTTTTYKAI